MDKKYMPQDKYQKKVGLISKSYKLKKELVDKFADACEKNGTSQAKVLSEFMLSYINKSNGIEN